MIFSKSNFLFSSLNLEIVFQHSCLKNYFLKILNLIKKNPLNFNLSNEIHEFCELYLRISSQLKFCGENVTK